LEVKKINVTAIIPAFNEEKTITNVIRALKQSPEVDRIIVVSDGSTDRTVEIAYRQEVDVIDLHENRGKGGAVKAGLDIANTEVILLLDADLIGLQPEHIVLLLEPVFSGRADMSIGLFGKGRAATDLAQKVAPFLSGQRALKRKIFEDISGLDISRFGIEVALHRYAEETNLRVEEVTLKDLSHVMKEEKMGLLKGGAARLKMYWEILLSAMKINDNNPLN